MVSREVTKPRFPKHWATADIKVRPDLKRRLEHIKKKTRKTPSMVIEEALPLWEEKYGVAA